MRILCYLGFHKWPRVHGPYREPVIEPMTAQCTRCHKPISSIWRHAFPADGSRCKGGSCAIHPHAA
jgi:hypothetical protein